MSREQLNYIKTTMELTPYYDLYGTNTILRIISFSFLYNCKIIDIYIEPIT